jgi:hypothetical protein
MEAGNAKLLKGAADHAVRSEQLQFAAIEPASSCDGIATSG